MITGAGRAFSAGADIGGGGGGTGTEWVWPYGLPEGVSLREHYDDWRDRDRANVDDQLYRWEYPKPIIGAVSGWCLGAGSWLALTCHMTIAADDAVFGQPEVRMASNTNFIWVLLAGAKNALRYALTGDHIDAEEALRIGIVNKVVPKEDLLDECFNIVERIALVPPETVKVNLAIATQGLEMMGSAKGPGPQRRAVGNGPRVQARGVQQAPRGRPERGRPESVPPSEGHALHAGALRAKGQGGVTAGAI